VDGDGVVDAEDATNGISGVTVTLNGTVAPGAGGPGTLTISNQFTCIATATNLFELGGTNAPVDFDRLLVSDIHNLDGVLRVVITNGYSPAAGDSFRIIENGLGLLLNNFATTDLPALAAGMGWDVLYASDSVTLVVTGAPTPTVATIGGSVLRDVDGDGVVDAEDATNGISGVTVTLTGPAVTNAALTDAAGGYSFTGLLAGTYTVTETDPAGYVSTMDADGTNDNVIVITVAGGDVSSTNWFLDRQLSAYENWAQSIPNPADRGDQADPDGDGYVNLWEYSQGSDPTNSGSVVKLQWYRTNGMAILRFNRATGAVDVVYEVEASYGFTNPAPWEVIASNVFGTGWSGDASVTETNSGAVRQVLTEDNDPASTRRGMRLRVTRP